MLAVGEQDDPLIFDKREEMTWCVCQNVKGLPSIIYRVDPILAILRGRNKKIFVRSRVCSKIAIDFYLLVLYVASYI
jgi:hypothetical protein